MYRLGIIGLGNIGLQHFRAAQNNYDVEVCAIADPNPPSLQLLPPEVARYKHWQDLITHPDLNAVSVCVPHYLHAPITFAALEAGLHVLVEKPLALTVREGAHLIESARENDRVLMVEMTHRFYPALREARAFVETGQLGDIYAVEDRIIEAAGQQIQPWLQDKSLAGGGVALTNGVHMLDRIASLTGQALNFECGRAGYSAGLGDVEDTAAMLLTLENGAPVQLLASWPQGNAGLDDEVTLYGTLGTLRVWAWRGWQFEPADRNKPTQSHLCHDEDEPVAARVQSGVRAAVQEFLEAIRENREPNPPAQAALDAQELIEQFYDCVQNAPLAVRESIAIP